MKTWREADESIAKIEGEQTARKIQLDAHEEELTSRQAALKVGPENHIRELELKHKDALEKQAVEHINKLRKAVVATEAARSNKDALKGKVQQLESDLVSSRQEVLKLKDGIQKAVVTLADL